MSGGLGPARPCDFDLSVLGYTVTKVQIDKALIRNPSLDRHVLEIEHHIFREAHGDWLLELGGIGVLPGLHFGKVVFSFHDWSPP